jgi:hypothetical protein
MPSTNLYLLLISLVILLLALVPWWRLAFAAYKNRALVTTVFKGALVTFLIVGTLLGILLATLEWVGEYGVYLMMVILIFGSWLGYLATKKRMRQLPARPMAAPSREA